ncbi:circadian-associated transcriptional repressor [Rissa tridactyla]|uniref:circadian-associated transcriptional repressor n=1 Tax=Rissa tridactyla TaxID=75485 RepID=UPI0023BAE12A|nr:circadian-associated transcriptional repressor [Rissa tridactyla]
MGRGDGVARGAASALGSAGGGAGQPGRGGGAGRGGSARLPGGGGQWARGGAGPSGRHVRPRTCPRGAAAAGAEPAPGPGRGHRDIATAPPGQRYRYRDSDSGTRTAVPAPERGHRHSRSCSREQAASAGQHHRSRTWGEALPGGPPLPWSPPQPTPAPAAPPPPAQGFPPLGPPQNLSGAASAQGGRRDHPPNRPRHPVGGNGPRRGRGGDTSPSDGDRLFAQKCQELRGFIRPLAELLQGLKQGRYDKGLSSFQQSVAMDRIQRIIGVLQKPQMGARYLGTLLQVEGMLRVWFPHVAPKPPQDPSPPPAAATAPLRRRPPAGPPGAPRCRRRPGDTPRSTGTSHRGCQTGTPASPRAPDA